MTEPISHKKIEYKVIQKEIIEEPEHNVYYYIKRYIQEVIEASIGITIFLLISKRQFEYLDIARISSIVGFVTLLLEEYNKDYASTLKEGVLFTIGASSIYI